MTQPGSLAPLNCSGRLDRLRASLVPADLGALLVTTLANIRWLTGFSGSAGLLLVTPDRAVLTTDGRYRTQASDQLADAGVAGDIEVTVGGLQGQRDAVVAGTQAIGTVGLEADDVTWNAQQTWVDLFADCDVRPTRLLVEDLRITKDAAEIDRMDRAAGIADHALASVLPLLHQAPRTPLSESAFAAALDHAMRLGGAEESAFETIVASGPNSAKPHARPSDRQIRAGDAVVVDFGAVYDGYRSDMTRTFCVGGEPQGDLATVFSVVAASQVAGVDTVKPGITAGAVDKVCRDVIAEAGWADRFEHGTGHGVGLDIHEAPSVGPESTAILAPGVVVTVEPGVYLAGLGGVRIEDTLVVTEHGSRSLTRFPKDVAV